MPSPNSTICLETAYLQGANRFYLVDLYYWGMQKTVGDIPNKTIRSIVNDSNSMFQSWFEA